MRFVLLRRPLRMRFVLLRRPLRMRFVLLRLLLLLRLRVFLHPQAGCVKNFFTLLNSGIL
jgi:hypothetical protein